MRFFSLNGMAALGQQLARYRLRLIDQRAFFEAISRRTEPAHNVAAIHYPISNHRDHGCSVRWGTGFVYFGRGQRRARWAAGAVVEPENYAGSISRPDCR